jgi:hypothetical protein
LCPFSANRSASRQLCIDACAEYFAAQAMPATNLWDSSAFELSSVVVTSWNVAAAVVDVV